jgi:hypothetical protein
MNKDRILALLNQHREEMRTRFKVKHLALFGSAARDEMSGTSDVDMLVEFDGAATFAGYMDLKFYLEALLGCSVDLVTEKALRSEIRPYVEKEAIRVA